MTVLRLPSPNDSPTRALDLMRKFGLEPDPWQANILQSRPPRLLLNCCRQAGKSTTVALLGLTETIFVPGTFVLLLSRSLRQSTELFKTLADFYVRLGKPLCERLNAHELRLLNRSRVVSLPCKADTIRGFAGVDLLIIDEAARVPDDLYRTARPMLAVSKGRLILLSTPYGKRGFFHDAWTHGGDDWFRVEIPAATVPRISADFLAQERRAMGESWFRQEYCCSFEALEGLVYPNFARCVVPGPAPSGKRLGGLDFGLRDPFVALWGVLDANHILWITGEHYSRDQSLSYHAKHLPPGITWYADPSGARDIKELRCAGFTIHKADNERRPGIAAVRARLENGTLKVFAGDCPNLIAEAGLYRYEVESGRKSEDPADGHDHALDALRYLVSKIDTGRMAKLRHERPTPPAAPPPKPRKWLSLYNEELWTPLP